MGDNLIRYVIASALLHVAVSGGYVGFASSQPKATRPPIYKARVVSLPGPKGAAGASLAMPAPEPAKPQVTPPKPEVEKPKPPVKEPPKEQVRTAKPKKETQSVPAPAKSKTKKVPETNGKPDAKSTKDEPGVQEDRRTGGFKGKRVEAPAATPTSLPGGGSASIGVDATDFTFSYYLVTIQNKIAGEWDPPPGLAPGTTLLSVIYFQIERDGRIVRPEVETSSGVPVFDETARRAVQRAALPPLPDEFGDERLGVHFQFEFTP